MSWLRSESPAIALPSSDSDGSDAELVARARLGDSRAFALLYRRYVPRVYDFAARRLATREAAEDATQTIFLRAIAALDSCRDDRLFAGWLFAIARNVIADTHRSGRVSMVSLDGVDTVEDTGEPVEIVALRAAWTGELARLRETCLKENDRELLDLRLQGLSDREIAVTLNRSHGAVRIAQFRLIRRLRACLGMADRDEEADRANA